MIYVIATIEVAEGTRDAFLTEFRKLVPQVQAENGCLAYGPTVDVDSGLTAQVPMRANIVTVVEQWESLAALTAHSRSAHMEAFRPRVKDLVIATTLQVLQPT